MTLAKQEVPHIIRSAQSLEQTLTTVEDEAVGLRDSIAHLRDRIMRGERITDQDILSIAESIKNMQEGAVRVGEDFQRQIQKPFGVE